ncbi:unnamed protein product [Rangifer tarandus platyrhynchus]|uniref:Uncharacterized protein n=2 Tax=Rangifer tarandus platyrhynchus TaxID=3082113 RepID=A0ACB0EMU4_RANTA|nr:unnamed protein product [Rangifer tarandus platyrhynchus]CAI9701613.1 unnamed protein product [Rangifer tarandus platyrhynchus]
MGQGGGTAGMKSHQPGSSGEMREKDQEETLPNASTSEKGLLIKRPRWEPKPRLHTLPNVQGPQPQGERCAAGGSERSPRVPEGVGPAPAPALPSHRQLRAGLFGRPQRPASGPACIYKHTAPQTGLTDIISHGPAVPAACFPTSHRGRPPVIGADGNRALPARGTQPAAHSQRRPPSRGPGAGPSW